MAAFQLGATVSGPVCKLGHLHGLLTCLNATDPSSDLLVPPVLFLLCQIKMSGVKKKRLLKVAL